MITDFSDPDVRRRLCPHGQLALRLRNYAEIMDHQRPDHRRATFADGARRLAQMRQPTGAEQERGILAGRAAASPPG